MATAVPNPLEQLSLADLRRRTSLKWRAYPDDVLPMFVAEMDARLAEPVAEALRRAIADGDTGYPTDLAYAEALAGFADVRWGWSVDPARTALVADVMTGIVEVLGLTTSPGDAVIVTPPVYPPFYGYLTHAHRRIIEAPLDHADRLDLELLEDACRQATAGGRPAALLLCNPHNPTGTVHRPDELAAVAELAHRHGVRVVADEIHAPLVLPGSTFTPFLSLPAASRGFSVMSASKGWNLAGLKAALVLAGPDAADELTRLPEVVSHGPSHLGVISHVAAYRDGGPWLDALLPAVRHNRDLLSALLAEQLPGVGYRPGAATYLAWLDCRGLVTAQESPTAVFVEHGRVALLDGADFGAGGAGHARFNFATSSGLVREAVRRMTAAVRAAPPA